ncbi:MAG: cryptochrome/photolyase family protein [Bacteroidetes bacterium]|nr:cryptochrome/photolyase family protein [Bacteroidota bacterium]
MKTLRLLFGDQLNPTHSWFQKVDDSVIYCLFEMRQETDYAWHHVQKVIAFFLAMRAFAEELRSKGHHVKYLTLDHPGNRQNLPDNLHFFIEKYQAERFEYLLSDEWRLDEQLRQFCEALTIPSGAFDTEHFMAERHGLRDFFGEKNYLMESFYRAMRRKYDVLMDGDQPATGQWNYDHDNRQKLPKNHVPPQPLLFQRDVSDILQLLEKQEVKTIGKVEAKDFSWPVTRAEGLKTLEYFCKNLLHHFGDFQDAMTPHHWSLYHSRLSFVMNVKLLSPLEVVHRAVDEWQRRPDEISFSQIEAFVRQIIGWREYMQGIYWAKMPDFAKLNFFQNDRPLPSWFWTGKTKMACLRHSINQSLEHAYAHHIQRLMVTGNFALLAGIAPDKVDAWYLGIYIDAIEWVEITNTRGMSQFADGGIVGTKPYCSSAAYIHKMSHYCEGCFYKKDLRTGERACPFNSLYWHFHDRHREKLERNPRIGMVYRTWDKMSGEARATTLEQAEFYLEKIEEI